MELASMKLLRRIPLAKWSLCVALYVLAAVPATASADDPKPKLDPLPKVFEKATPENVKDLREIEAHVRKVLEKVVPCTVALRIGPAQGSGVIVKDGFVLT